MFDAVYFISLFNDFDTNEREIYDILHEMDEDDLNDFKHTCENNLAKYYDIYNCTDNAWHIIHEED